MHSANTAKINGNYMTHLNFYLLTDTHYFEESLGAEGKAYEEYMKTEAFYLKESSMINKTVFKKLKEDKEFLSDLRYYSDNGRITLFVKNE